MLLNGNLQYTYGWLCATKIKIYKIISTLTVRHSDIYILLYPILLYINCWSQPTKLVLEIKGHDALFEKTLTRQSHSSENVHMCMCVCARVCVRKLMHKISASLGHNLLFQIPLKWTHLTIIPLAKKSPQHLVKLRSFSGVFANVPKWDFITPSPDKFKRSLSYIRLQHLTICPPALKEMCTILLPPIIGIWRMESGVYNGDVNRNNQVQSVLIIRLTKGLLWGQLVATCSSLIYFLFTVINSFYGNKEMCFQSQIKRHMKYAQKIFSVGKHIVFSCFLGRGNKSIATHSTFPWSHNYSNIKGVSLDLVKKNWSWVQILALPLTSCSTMRGKLSLFKPTL